MSVAAPAPPVLSPRAAAPGAAASGGRLQVLDGLRFVAVLMVVLYHYIAFGSDWSRPRAELFPLLYQPAAYGWLGVQLFFLISGFVICLSCWGRSLSDFLTSRVVRLFPAYWFGVLVTTLVLASVPGGSRPRAGRDVLTNLTMMEYPFGAPYVDGVYWSLWVEGRFYLIFAVVVAFGLSYRRVLAFCLLWAAAGVLATAAPGEQLLQVLAMPEYCWFFIGGLAFYLMRRFGPDLLLWLLVGLTFLLGCRAALPTFRFVASQAGHPMSEWAMVAVIAAFYLLMAGVALDWFRAVDWRWLTTAGAVTYPLYLLHEYIGWEVISTVGGRVDARLLVAVLLVVMTGASWLVHRYVERPSARWLKPRLAASFAKVRAAGAPPVRRPAHPAEHGPADADAHGPAHAHAHGDGPDRSGRADACPPGRARAAAGRAPERLPDRAPARIPDRAVGPAR
ncbi:acyltransferase family protein [Kitasatospora sp. NPDC059571]|uniref:acyltransferase family protein n=1 Tax=Kitasatospora sp. NPDC059571 TaxID=3346871 RepID=UPI003693631B